jgi:general L-amino acid transport system permease protein
MRITTPQIAKMSRAVLKERLPGYVGQALLLLLAAWLAWCGLTNFLVNARKLGISVGFGFLHSRSGFEVAQSLIPFTHASTYSDAVVVATLNTLLVVALSGILCTLTGLGIAFGRLSAHPLVRGATSAYVEVFRNIPLLLQIFFWYFSAIALLPPVGDSLHFGDVLLNNRGLFLPRIVFEPQFGLDVAHVEGMDVAGGFVLLPELMALTLGLSIYNSTFLAEIFRSGILSVPRGQSEAARTVGLSGVRAAVLVILPQALRVALPAAGGQYQTLTRASSLAAAIGYPDIMQIVGGTILSQTNQALEAMSLVVVLYAAINLLMSLGVNFANWRLMRREIR